MLNRDFSQSLGIILSVSIRFKMQKSLSVQKRVDNHYKVGIWKEYFNGNWTEKEMRDSLKNDYHIETLDFE